MGQCRAPGVEHGEKTDAGAEVFGIGRDGGHGLGRSLEQDAVDRGLILVGDVGDFGRQREHDVEVRHRQEFFLAFCQPLARRRSLTLRTVPVSARVVGDLGVAALLVLAARDMTAERCRAAVLDRRHHLELLEADMAGIGLAPCRSMVAENIRDLQYRARHAWCVLGRWLVFFTLQRRETIERAHDFPDGVGGNVCVDRRRFEFGVPK